MADKGKISIEGKSDDDDAWYTCSLEFDGKQVIVHFTDYGSSEDEVWDLDDFQTREDVLDKVRVTSEQLQDEGCRSVSLGMRVCALKEVRAEDEEDSEAEDFQTYFDAEVVQITRRAHSKRANGDEECKCTFRVRWEDGPDEGEAEDLECSAITILSDRNPEENPELKTFLDMVTANWKRKTRTSTRKEGSGHKRAPVSARKRSKPDTSVRGAVNEQPELLATGDEEARETPTTRMTERDVSSTTTEIRHLALQPNNGDTDSRHPLKVKDEGEENRGGGQLCPAAGHRDVRAGSLLNNLGVESIGLEISRCPDPDETEACRGHALQNDSSSDHHISIRTSNRGATGQQTPAEHLSSDLLVTPGQGPATVSGLDGHATSMSAALPPEQGAAPAPKPVCISDDMETGTQVFPQTQLAQTSDGGDNASEKVEQRMCAVKKVCRGLWPIDRIFRIDNVEKDLCPQLATAFLGEVFKSLISVFLFPAGENETSGSGFLIFEDSQSAEHEALQLVTNNIFVTSQRLRPWSVSRAKDSHEERELIAFTARGSQQAALKNIELSLGKSQESSRKTTQLRWILPGMKDYKLVAESLELHLAQRKELQTMWKTFNREEAAMKLQTIY